MRPWPRTGHFNDVTAALSGVGLGSVSGLAAAVSQVLSTGERFRADLARLLLDEPGQVVIDEFTSVVDRRTARTASAAFSKAWRRTNGQAVLISCHDDITPWLKPDWVFDTASRCFSRGLFRRPPVRLSISRVGWDYWPTFEIHHYLTLPQTHRRLSILGQGRARSGWRTWL